MSQVLHRLIEQHVKGLYHNDFQEFIEHLYVIRYGTDFTPVKQKRDRGCDGLLNNSRTVLAIYAPEKRDLRKFKRKVREDFTKYQDNWEPQYPNWQLVYNLSFTAEEIRYIESLKPDTRKVAPEHILEIVENLVWSDRRRVADYLGIDNQFFCNDVLVTILEDLLRDTNIVQDLPPYKKPVYIEEKIEINYSQEEVEMAKEQYGDCVLYFGALQRLLTGYADQQRHALKSKIRGNYGQLSGPFRERLEYLIERYSEKYAHDDVYRFYVQVVLLYFFEQCLVGERTQSETP
jgi:hypothetical protein